jgi:hypothetical protein
MIHIFSQFCVSINVVRTSSNFKLAVSVMHGSLPKQDKLIKMLI